MTLNPQLLRAVEVLRTGGVVLHATEGVWGLACDPWDTAAVDQLLRLKGRGEDKGLILIGGAADVFAPQLAQLSAARQTQIRQSWPGPHTWIVQDQTFPSIIRGGRATLACRVPGHAQARELCLAFGGPLVSSSANVSGEPAISCAEVARAQFAAQVGFMLPGAVGQTGKASTVHGLDGEILRQ